MSNDTVTVVETPVVETADKAAAWETFIEALALADYPEISVEHKKGFVKLEAKNGHKIYIAKQADEVKLVETTLEVAGLDNTLQLPKPNGRISARLVPTADVVAQFLPLLVAAEQIRAPKRGKQASK